jgi:hypothetical protein
MNKIILMKLGLIVIMTVLIGRLWLSAVLAQTGTITPSPTLTIDEKNIQNLKEKIATKVAELREKNNKAVSGFVTQIGDQSLKIKDEKDTEYEIKLDDALTKYYQVSGTQLKEIKLSDIKKGLFVIVTGVANDNVINANILYIDEMFLVKSGKITEVDKDNFSLKLLSSDKDAYTLEIETTTRQQMVNVKTLVAEPTGFSKIKEGDTIQFVVKKTGEEKNNTYSPTKILIIPQEFFMK